MHARISILLALALSLVAANATEIRLRLCVGEEADAGGCFGVHDSYNDGDTPPCISFTGPLAFFDKNVKGVILPDAEDLAETCTFYESPDCDQSTGRFFTVTEPGLTRFDNVTGSDGPMSFVDVASSVLCTALPEQ